jgi:hypothetical protein
MNYKPLIYAVVAPLVILLLFYLTSISPRVYVLDFGAGETKRIHCDSFSFQPTEYTVYCDGVSYFGVRDVSVK